MLRRRAAIGKRGLAPRRLVSENPRESELRPRVEETLPSGVLGLGGD